MKKLAGLEITNCQYQHIVDILTGKQDYTMRPWGIEDIKTEMPKVRIIHAVKYLKQISKGYDDLGISFALVSLKDAKTALDALSAKLNKPKILGDYINSGLKTNQFVLEAPKSVIVQLTQAGCNTNRVIFYAPFSSPTGFWVKVEPEYAEKEGYSKNRIFPISYMPASEVLNWPVLKILTS